MARSVLNERKPVRFPRRVIPIAAVVLVGAFLALKQFGDPPAAGVRGWEIVSNLGAVATEGTLLPDLSTVPGRVSLSAGSLTLRLPSGPLVTLAAPIDATFLDPMHMRLDRGRITVDVGERGKGFAVTTRHGKVVDLGTRFGVNSEDEADHVVVFDGEIELAPSSDPERVSTFKEGEAVVLESTGNLATSPSVITGPSEADWEFGPSEHPEAVITHVTDNNRERWSFRFYPLVLQGMTAGANAWPYETNKPCWWPLEGEFPEDLEGADLVQVLQQELGNKDLEITVTLGQPARLFVFHQSNSPLPGWLERDFVNTGDKLALSPSDPNGPKPDPFKPGFEVWARDVGQAGNVTLGAMNKQDIHSPPFYFYGIAAKALD
jgi:hypothetical protein